jgi:hypothetical protein
MCKVPPYVKGYLGQERGWLEDLSSSDTFVAPPVIARILPYQVLSSLFFFLLDSRSPDVNDTEGQTLREHCSGPL